MQDRIIVDALTKRFEDGTTALGGVSLRIPEGQFAAVVGPSGCGKTTLLHILAGLEQATSGHVQVCGNGARGSQMAMAFQEYVGLVVIAILGYVMTIGLEEIERVVLPLVHR